MVLMELTVPDLILKKKALLRRITADHPKRLKVEEDLKPYEVGYRGEKSLLYYLNFLSPEEFYIFHAIRLANGKDNYFQIDVLLLSLAFILILEVKNIAGHLLFDKSHQVIRTLNNTIEGFPNPISQVKLHALQLSKWFAANNLPCPPIETLVVISNKNTIIQADANYKEFYERVTHGYNIPEKIETLTRQYNQQCLSICEMDTIAKTVLEQHKDKKVNILEKYEISPNEIITGVLCINDKCSSKIPMMRKRDSWYCTACMQSSKLAHHTALEDYSHLISPTFTNLEARQFLHLPSRTTMLRILKSKGFVCEGERSTAKYSLLFTGEHPSPFT